MNFSLSSAAKGAVVVLAVVLVGCGGSGDGVREFEQGKEAYELRDLNKAERLFEKSLAAAPKDVDRMVYLARVELDLGNLSRAETLLKDVTALGCTDADVLLLGAEVAWHAKDYEAAAKAFSAVGNDKQLDAETRSQGWAGLGVVEMTCDHQHLARVAFLRAIRLDRRNASARYHLGLLYRDSFRYLEAALEQFEIFVRLEAEASPRVQKVQRTVIPGLKDEIARNATERPGVANRNSAACSTAIAKAEAAWKKGAFKNARQAYQEALKADPLSYQAAVGLAKAWEKTDSSKTGLSSAYTNYKLACALHPSSISTFLTTGALASRLGLHSQAVEVYSRAIAASPTSLEALDGLVRALRKVGKNGKVAEAYQQYRETLPSRKK